MGAVRIFLALAVVFNHMGIKAPGMDGYVAVMMFFAISGFYMGLVLNEKYTTGFAAFYLARYLRLWPSYIAVFVLVTIFVKGVPTSESWLVSAYLWFVSISMFFYETLWWLVYGADHFELVASVRQSMSGAVNMPHMWSIGIELVFYLVSPFVARSPWRLFAAGVAAYAVHAWITTHLPVHDPFRYRSAFNYFWIFFCGVGSYWVWRAVRDKITALVRAPYPIMAVAFVTLAWAAVVMTRAQTSATPNGLLPDVYLALFALAAGPIFQTTRGIDIDRRIGDLSYSVYLVHWPFAAVIFRDKNGEWEWALVAAALSVGLALLLYHAIEMPVDRFRQSLWRRSNATSTSPGLVAVNG